MKEYVLSTNNFGEGRIYSNNEARGLNLLRLLILKPGTNPLFPLMGCYIEQYRYCSKDILPTIKSRVQDQIEKYLPECMLDSVQIQITKTNFINIIIQCRDASYIYESENEDIPIELDSAA